MIALWGIAGSREPPQVRHRCPAGLLCNDQWTARAPCARPADRVDSPQAGVAGSRRGPFLPARARSRTAARSRYAVNL
jgi:hypothetical protein